MQSQQLINQSRQIYASDGESALFFDVADIIFLQACRKTSVLFSHAHQREFEVRIGLSDIYTQLDPSTFARIHRSTIVNRDFVESVEVNDDGRLMVVMRGVARSFRVAQVVNDLVRMPGSTTSA